jgi:ABC-type proline/glycine betaine transport system ATPase subunit
MKQRAALARTLILEPDILLMDEPFAALDAQTRELLQEQVQTIWQQTGKTVVFITHDVREAIFLGSRVAMATTGGAVKGKQYQAVFLTNGQVYFGKLKNPDSAYVKLTDIYYLQVQQTVQPDQQKEDANKQPNVSLAKLGSELHGPEDTMYISRDQILFWENLKDDGKVTQAIKDYQSGAKK